MPYVHSTRYRCLRFGSNSPRYGLRLFRDGSRQHSEWFWGIKDGGSKPSACAPSAKSFFSGAARGWSIWMAANRLSRQTEFAPPRHLSGVRSTSSSGLRDSCIECSGMSQTLLVPIRTYTLHQEERESTLFGACVTPEPRGVSELR